MQRFDLPFCAPEEVGISSSQVVSCLKALNHELTTMNGFMAARHGKVFSSCWWDPYKPNMPHSNHSFGKSYTSTAIGIAVGEGLLSLDEKMVDIFAQEIKEKKLQIPKGVDKITVRHVLTMTNGMAYHPDMTGDFIAHYLTTPLAYEPGTHFAYNSTGSCMLGAIILKRSGSNLKNYLTPRLFQKIGIDPDTFVWRQFRGTGIDAEPGTFAPTEANLRLAMLYLQDGKWNNEQIIPEDYVRDTLKIHITTEYAPEQKDGLCGYGYQCWACSIPGVFRFDGGQGQYGIIWPEKDLVIALHEGAIGPLGPQKTLDVLYDHLLNFVQDDPLPPDEASLQTLRSIEASAKLENDEPSSCEPNTAFLGSYTVEDGIFDPWLSASPPGNGDLFVMFRTPILDIPIREFSIQLEAENLVISTDTGSKLIASLDGTLTAYKVDSPFDVLADYAASARFHEDGTMDIYFHWLNGWFETNMYFKRTGDGLQILTKKLRLHTDDNYLIYNTFAKKMED